MITVSTKMLYEEVREIFLRSGKVGEDESWKKVTTLWDILNVQLLNSH